MRRVSLGLAVLAALNLGACGDDEFILKPPANRSPSIVLHGPEFPVNGVETVDGVDLAYWVLVADPDGLEDISGVFFEVESILLRRAIARPLVDAGFCADISYADNDTLEIAPLIPSEFPGATFQAQKDQGGIYSSPPFCAALYPSEALCGAGLFPDVGSSSDSFGPLLATCISCPGSCSRYDAFGVYPPAVPTPIDAVITQAEIEYVGITATVYDAAGTSAVTTLPNIRVVYRTEQEAAAAP